MKGKPNKVVRFRGGVLDGFTRLLKTDRRGNIPPEYTHAEHKFDPIYCGSWDENDHYILDEAGKTYQFQNKYKSNGYYP